jgi:hypothetical protein
MWRVSEGEERDRPIDEAEQAAERIRELEAQLAAQPKLEWRDPETAPKRESLLMLSRYGRVFTGITNGRQWFPDGTVPLSPYQISGWLPLDALGPPALSNEKVNPMADRRIPPSFLEPKIDVSRLPGRVSLSEP